jgi:hypothetical protein
MKIQKLQVSYSAVDFSMLGYDKVPLSLHENFIKEKKPSSKQEHHIEEDGLRAYIF